MKKLFFAAMTACCLIAATNLSAQDRPNRGGKPMTAEDMAKFGTERMAEKLKLDDVQKQEVYKLNLEQAQQMQASRAAREAADAEARKADREKMQQQRAAYDAKLKKLLSEEQYKQWTEDRQAQRGHRPDGRRGQGPRKGAPRKPGAAAGKKAQ